MSRVHVRILHLEPGEDVGPLTRVLVDARSALAERHRAGFESAGADDVRIVAGPPDDRGFGALLRGIAAEAAAARAHGLVVLGSGAMPLATASDLRAFIDVAGGPAGRALANNRYSGDVIAVSGTGALEAVPDGMTGDNALPRWLAEEAGFTVDDLRARWQLGVDLDSPQDIVLTTAGPGGGVAAGRESGLAPELVERLAARIGAVVALAGDSRAELLLHGRTSAATLAHLERHAACRVRALVEERGMRTAPAEQRPSRSVIGTALEVGGPGTLGTLLARFGDAAVVDTRVLLAHRLGRDERRWPSAEDRFASDLLLPERIRDPWLRALTAAAAAAKIPILLGGHTLVGPGLRLLVGATDESAS